MTTTMTAVANSGQAVRVDDVPDPEVAERAKRRSYTARYKRDVMGREVSGANHIVQRSLGGQMPGYPNMYVPIVDVRDVAAAHVAAMTAPAAAGQRFLVTGGQPAMAMKQIGAILKEHFGDAAKGVSTRSIPNAVVRLAALFNDEFKPVAADLGYVKQVSGKKAADLLGVHPRRPEEAIIAAGESMIEKSLV